MQKTVSAETGVGWHDLLTAALWTWDSPSNGSQMATTAAELNRYFQMIHQRVPMRVSVFIRWLRKPSSFAGRVIVAFMLVIGGVFSFLPVLGLWMLPLGLLLISQDVPFLQKPLVATLAWLESKWVSLKGKWKRAKLSRQTGS